MLDASGRHRSSQYNVCERALHRRGISTVPRISQVWQFVVSTATHLTGKQSAGHTWRNFASNPWNLTKAAACTHQREVAARRQPSCDVRSTGNYGVSLSLLGSHEFFRS
jgi:hypothetical protein